jgi:hypothetical protein
MIVITIAIVMTVERDYVDDFWQRKKNARNTILNIKSIVYCGGMMV